MEEKSQKTNLVETKNKNMKTKQVRRPPRNITYHEPVAQCHYCQKNPHAPECAEAVQAFAEYEAQGAAETAAKYGGGGGAHHAAAGAHGGAARGAGHH